MRSTSSRVRSATDRRWRRGVAEARGSDMGSVLALADEEHSVALVDLDELDLDALVAPGREVLADVVRPDRQLAMATVDQDRELHARGPAVLEERIDRGPNRPPRVQHVVDEDD